MTIVEIWGFCESGSWGVADFHKRIEALFANGPVCDAIMISQVWSLVQNRHRENKPLLRVSGTDIEEVEYICSVLRMNGFNVVRPLVLISFTKSAMWDETDIRRDLALIQCGKFGPAALVGSETDEAIKDLGFHLYTAVANFYRLAANEMRKSLTDPTWVPTPEDLAEKASVRGQDPIKARLIKIAQIVDSLDPPEPREE